MFLLELPHRGNSNEHTQYTFFNIKKMKITINYPKSAAVGFSTRFIKGNKFCDFLHISLISATFSTDILMDDLRYYVLFNSVTVISE